MKNETHHRNSLSRRVLAACARSCTTGLSGLAVVLACLSITTSARAETGDLTVQFVVDGDLPAAQPILNAKDFEGAGLKYENVVVGPNKEVANVVIYLRTKDVAVTPEATAAAPAEVTFDNKGGRFQPHILPVWVGKQTVLLTNSDSVGHNVNIQPLGNPPKNSLIPGGGKDTYQFAAPCSLPSPTGCNIHPWMQAFLVAKEHPYVGVSDADGKLTIKNLPTGMDLEFQVWHEKVGFLEAQPAWIKGRFTLNPKPGANDLGVVKIPAKLLQ